MDERENQVEETTEAHTETPVEDAPDTPAMISYDDFAKLDIAIGEIMEVEVVEDADKLLKLTVEVGESVPRQIVSGIRMYFEDPQSLVGTKCPFLLNLEPRMIRGLESQGMILASSYEEVLALLVPSNNVPAGTRIN